MVPCVSPLGRTHARSRTGISRSSGTLPREEPTSFPCVSAPFPHGTVPADASRYYVTLNNDISRVWFVTAGNFTRCDQIRWGHRGAKFGPTFNPSL